MSPDFERKLIGALGSDSILIAEPMALHTTFKIGGPADYLVRPTAVEQVRAVVDLCRDNGVDLRVIGLGSDLLVSDSGLRGVVMEIADNFSEINVDERGLVSAQAGASNASVARAALEAGLSGYEFASGIPGTVGGAAIMNAGAYGGEFSDVALSCVCVTREGDLLEVRADQADWGYRHSRMDDEGMIVLAVLLQLVPGDKNEIQARMDDLVERRAAKQPLEMPSAGSTFKRPEGHYAGKLIQDAGLQGTAVGGAEVSKKHAGFVVNAGGATAEDVRGLIGLIRDSVFDESGVRLEPEVRMWGFGR